MTLIKSISGMRGTIGGKSGSNLTPIDIVEMCSAYALWILKNGKNKKVVVGRDGRISGSMVSSLAVNTLMAMGIDVVDLGLSTTPTVEMAVPFLTAGGGIIFTASHNPKQWNALKLLNDKGEFISAADGQELLDIVSTGSFEFAAIDHIGTYRQDNSLMAHHIGEILALKYIDTDAIRKRNFKVVADCINSTGALILPKLFEALNCRFTLIHDDISGDFAHNPEPVPAHLSDLSQAVIQQGADLGIAVDPDVDRLVFVNEDGSMFGEEYTLVAVADFVLQQKPGTTVSNLSSTRALADISRTYNSNYYAAAVGEVNVVSKMKEVQAVIGGEGNGGVILPDLHYGRDAIVGIVMMLNHMVNEAKPVSEIRQKYTDYKIIKSKLELNEKTDINKMFDKLKKTYLNERLNEEDGLKIDFNEGWVHLRKSNTEPIIRLIAEAKEEAVAEKLITQILNIINGES